MNVLSPKGNKPVESQVSRRNEAKVMNVVGALADALRDCYHGATATLLLKSGRGKGVWELRPRMGAVERVGYEVPSSGCWDIGRTMVASSKSRGRKWKREGIAR